MELDHIFIFCAPQDGNEERLKSIGLVETYRRRHPGQGTENVCFCFENAFIELLWVNDEAEVKNTSVARTALYERSRHLEIGTCPFGIAWRGQTSIPTWQYRPSYLPPNMHIDVAIDGDDPKQPMMFKSPGNNPPSAWPNERRGDLQRLAGFDMFRIREFVMPSHTSPSQTLCTLANAFGFSISRSGEEYRMDVEMYPRQGQPPILLSFHH